MRRPCDAGQDRPRERAREQRPADPAREESTARIRAIGRGVPRVMVVRASRRAPGMRGTIARRRQGSWPAVSTPIRACLRPPRQRLVAVQLVVVRYRRRRCSRSAQWLARSSSGECHACGERLARSRSRSSPRRRARQWRVSAPSCASRNCAGAGAARRRRALMTPFLFLNAAPQLSRTTRRASRRRRVRRGPRAG